MLSVCINIVYGRALFNGFHCKITDNYEYKLDKSKQDV